MLLVHSSFDLIHRDGLQHPPSCDAVDVEGMTFFISGE